MPKGCENDDRSPNAFATGRNPHRVALPSLPASSGRRGVKAHSGSRGTPIIAVVATLGGVVTMMVYPAQFTSWLGSFGNDEDGDGGSIIGLLIGAVVMPIAATLA